VLVLFLGACRSLPTDYPRSDSHVVPDADTAATRLGRDVAAEVARHGNQSGVYLLDRGIDAFVARLALAEMADKSLDVQYYIWHDDTTGRVLTHALLRAADRGVRVRVILDDVGSAADDLALLTIDAHPNIEVRLFNPLATRKARGLGMLTDFSRTNRRMHNKSFTADNRVAIVGGRNIGDEYFEAKEDLDFGDLDTLLIGPAVPQVSQGFDRYWNDPAVIPIAALSGARPTDQEITAARAQLEAFVLSRRASPYAEALRVSGLAQGLRAGKLDFSFGEARVLYDDPAKAGSGAADPSKLLLPQLSAEFQGLTSELLVVSPYFVPGDGGVDALRQLRARGVRVRVLTNALAATDVPVVHAGYARYRRALLEAGVELYEVKPTATRAAAQREQRRERDAGATHGVTGSSRASLHAKTLVFDRRALFVGSMNLDPRSVYTNTEIGVLVENPGLVDAHLARFDAALPGMAYRVTLARTGDDAAIEWWSREDGHDVRYTQEPMTGHWQRFKVWFYSLWPIEPLL
jgi:putative cardiolipin synthase